MKKPACSQPTRQDDTHTHSHTYAHAYIHTHSHMHFCLAVWTLQTLKEKKFHISRHYFFFFSSFFKIFLYKLIKLLFCSNLFIALPFSFIFLLFVGCSLFYPLFFLPNNWLTNQGLLFTEFYTNITTIKFNGKTNALKKIKKSENYKIKEYLPMKLGEKRF